MHSVRPLFLSMYPPEDCCIATLTKKIADAVDLAAGEEVCAVAAIRGERAFDYDDPRIVHIVDNSRPNDYSLAAQLANDGPCDVVSVQHEFGLYPGDSGDRILEFMRKCRKPVVTTFHSLLTKPSPSQRRLIQELASLSRGLVVMTKSAVRLLASVYAVSAVHPVRVILHGVAPDVPDPRQEVDGRKMPESTSDTLEAARRFVNDVGQEMFQTGTDECAPPISWPQVGVEYLELFDQVVATREKRLGTRFLSSFARPVIGMARQRHTNNGWIDKRPVVSAEATADVPQAGPPTDRLPPDIEQAERENHRRGDGCQG